MKLDFKFFNMGKLKIILILGIFTGMFISCGKKATHSQLEKYFEQNILNNNFIITYANDDGDLITGNYNGYNFILKKGSDYYNGPMAVSKGSNNYSGTWSSNDDYSKLKIVLPNTPAEFVFLTREWRFTSKNIPVLKFAPWGSSANIALTMERK